MTIKEKILQNLPNNNQGLITPDKLREVLEAIDDKVEGVFFEGEIPFKLDTSDITQHQDFTLPFINDSDNVEVRGNLIHIENDDIQLISFIGLASIEIVLGLPLFAPTQYLFIGIKDNGIFEEIQLVYNVIDFIKYQYLYDSNDETHEYSRRVQDSANELYSDLLTLEADFLGNITNLKPDASTITTLNDLKDFLIDINLLS